MRAVGALDRWKNVWKVLSGRKRAAAAGGAPENSRPAPLRLLQVQVFAEGCTHTTWQMARRACAWEQATMDTINRTPTEVA